MRSSVVLTNLSPLVFSYLLSSPLPSHMKSVNDIMPMIGARFYTQLDAAQVKCDVLEGELAKVIISEISDIFGIVSQINLP